MTETVQWLIRNKDGRIDGPYTTAEVVKKIRAGFYLGEEFISKYPSGRWNPISYDQNFFNTLLEVLEDEMGETPKNTKNPDLEITDESEDFVNVDKDEGAAIREVIDNKTPLVIDVEVEEKKVHQGKAVSQKKRPKRKAKRVPKKKKVSKRTQRAKIQWIVAAVVCLVVYFVISDGTQTNTNEGRIRLVAPREKVSQKMTRDQYRTRMKRAIEYFRKDTLKDYLRAQDAFVEIVEKSNDLSAYSFLCMTYRELWPHSLQDEKDDKTVQTVLRMVQKNNPASTSSSVCLVVSQWTKGKYEDAFRMMSAHLLQSPGLVFFNQMTGDIYASRKDYRAASYYFAKVRELWTPPPTWSKAILQEARMYRKRKVFGTAVKLYRKLLKDNPHHAVAKIELGIVEFEPFQNISKSQDYIRSGLSSNQFIPKMIEAEAYVTLAKISRIQGDQKQALKMAQKAFATDSSNEDAREIIVNVGGLKALNAITIDNVNMVYLGEQYMKMSNYTAAQAEFRAAFEANKKNAFAALRAGQALWKLNQSNEAIAWVKKSVIADPSFLRSYLILADYMSARYDYVGAIEVLKSAREINRHHHGIYRGFALVELRRRNYDGAIRFSEKALQLYDTDIEAKLILAKAYFYAGDAETAFKFVHQAIELDSSNEDAHGTYAKILVSLQGTQAGITYLEDLISRYDKISYIRSLGEILAEEERAQEAIQVYYDALRKNPKDKPTLMALGRILQREKDYTGARDYLLEAAAIDPSDAEPLFLTGQLYLESNKAAFGLKQFERVIDVNKKYPLAHYYAGLALLSLGRNQEALEMAQAEKRLNPGISEPYTLAADAHFKMKQYKLCTGEYQQAIAKGLDSADSYIRLARCQRLSGALDAALTMLTEASARESGNPNVYKELGALYEMTGDRIKAVTSYNRYLQLSPQARDKSSIKAKINKIQSAGE